MNDGGSITDDEIVAHCEKCGRRFVWIPDGLKRDEFINTDSDGKRYVCKGKLKKRERGKR